MKPETGGRRPWRGPVWPRPLKQQEEVRPPSLFRLDSKSFSAVHTQSAGSAPEAVAFGPIFLAVARLAVDLVHMNGHRRAVQVLLADHLNRTKKGTFRHPDSFPSC